MRRRFILVSVVIATACARRDEAQSIRPPATHNPAPPVERSEVEPPPAAEEVDADSTESPEHERWYEPLAVSSLSPLDQEQQKDVEACRQAHPIDGQHVGPDELLAAGECFGEIPAPGREIQIYKHLVRLFPESAQAHSATRRLAQRLEQIDARAPAIDAYAAYLRRYPKHDDARELGQRAVCLAHSLGLEDQVARLLEDLERYYGHRGFVRPDADALSRLCADVPPVRKADR